MRCLCCCQCSTKMFAKNRKSKKVCICLSVPLKKNKKKTIPSILRGTERQTQSFCRCLKQSRPTLGSVPLSGNHTFCARVQGTGYQQTMPFISLWWVVQCMNLLHYAQLAGIVPDLWPYVKFMCGPLIKKFENPWYSWLNMVNQAQR